MHPLHIKTVITSIAVVFLCAAAHAQDNLASSADNGPAQRLCKQEDLVGHVFKMVDFKETPPRGEARWTKMFPNQYLGFLPGNNYSFLAINRDIKTPQQAEKYMKALQNGRQYTLSADGVLNLLVYDKIKFSYRCVTILKPVGQFAKGDFIVTGYTRKRKSELYRLYRRWY
jgi:hypothetical protein